MRNQSVRIFATFASLLATPLLAGCGQRVVVNNGPEGWKNLRFIAMAYNQTTADRGQPPKRVDDIMPLLTTLGDPKELLVSSRDGKPYVIVWGLDVRKTSPGRGAMSGQVPMASGLPVLAYEQEGRDGKRQVIDLSMTVTEFTSEECARLKLAGK